MNPSENEGVHKCDVCNSEDLFNFHEEYPAMISIAHKVANTEARAL